MKKKNDFRTTESTAADSALNQAPHLQPMRRDAGKAYSDDDADMAEGKTKLASAFRAPVTRKSASDCFGILAFALVMQQGLNSPEPV